MKRLMVAVFMVAGTSAALAQQVVQTPEQQAMANKLMQEISGSLQCQAALITAQKEIEELRRKNGKETPNVPSPPR
jgi:hypothetical protein